MIALVDAEDAAKFNQEALMFVDSFSEGSVYWGRAAIILGAVMAVLFALSQIS